MKKIFITLLAAMLVWSCGQSANTKPKTMETTTQVVKGHYADINGIKFYYEVYGEGKPLILIHGGGSTIGTSFGRIIPHLEGSGYQLIGVELQNHGHSGHRPVPETFEQDADDVFALIQQLKLGKADIMGFSNGANTAMQVAIRHPQAVNKLVLCSGFYKRNGMAEWFWPMLQKGGNLKDMPAPLHKAFLDANPNKTELEHMFNADRNRMLNFKDWTDDMLRSITAPTQFIAADEDVMTVEHTVAMFRLLPHARLAIFPGVHGQYLGEICSKATDVEISATANLVKQFLSAQH